MSKISNEEMNSKIHKLIFKTQLVTEIPSDLIKLKRPKRGPLLLQEILKLIETLNKTKPYPETLTRASIMRNSNTSIVSLLSRRKETSYVKPAPDAAMHILTSLENAKRILKGQYAEEQQGKSAQRQNYCFEEALYYVLTYGSHSDILQFLMNHQQITAALNYYIVQNLDANLFIHHIFLKRLSCGQMPALINQILEADPNLVIWRKTFLQTCRFLETNNYLNCLYQLQVLLKDPIRASMTCVKFYTMNCENFQHLLDNASHLHNAHQFLQLELEKSQWENINTERRRKDSINSNIRRSSSVRDTSVGFAMQMDARTLNGHINTIIQQLDVTKFLAKCEKESNNSKLSTEVVLKQVSQTTD